VSEANAHELLIVGGGPAALSAARAYREAEGPGSVGIVTDERRMPYERPSLSKGLLRGEIAEEEIPLESERWPAQHDVALVGGRAVSLDFAQRTLLLSGGREIAYGSCLLATGAEPVRLPIPGADDPGVRTLRSLEDNRELRARLRRTPSILVIGSGFIGCEIAASLSMLGHRVTLVAEESAPNVGRLGEQAAAEIQRWLEALGIRLILGSGVDAIERSEDRLSVVAGDENPAGDLVIMAVGVKPRAELAALAGVSLQNGAIPADAQMRTEAPGVLAAGDVCLAENAAAGRRVHIEHWGDALGQGEVAGQSAAGREASWAQAPGFWSTIGDHTLKYAGWGDGFDDVRWESAPAGGFVAWYGREGTLVGVLAHQADNAYERGRDLITQGAAWD
jgi:3-phenylpropionate/trans-cinnamate dioxygenase ferredoxin reductase component